MEELVGSFHHGFFFFFLLSQALISYVFEYDYVRESV